ncbi:MAG: methyltransferase domain-containing protein [Rhizobiales bacterium]|nr:methyltransferase domain-containing protein [Hyphomicrobiales bacterium]
MTDITDRVRAHYDGPLLVDRIRAALAPVAAEGQPLTVAQLAMLDQFHTRGILATAELAGAADLKAADRVLDLGCGVGGPARYLASTFGCHVTGVDLSPSFIEAADYLTARCGLEDQVTFRVGDALRIPFVNGSFDCVFLQHVAMNIADRAAFYAEVRRVLKPGGRFAAYDIVLREGDVVYPAPWARDASTSFLLTAEDTRAALENAGFTATLWRDDTQTALDWFQAVSASPPPAGPSLGVIMGSDFPAVAGNLGRNIREGRVGVLSAVLTRD